MRFLRALLGGLLWLVASVVGLVGVIACVTLILLPLGIPLLGLARRLFGEVIAPLPPARRRAPHKGAQETWTEGTQGGRQAGREVASHYP